MKFLQPMSLYKGKDYTEHLGYESHCIVNSNKFAMVSSK